MASGGGARPFSRVLYHLGSIPILLWGIRTWRVMAAAFLGLPIRTPFTVTLRERGLRFRVRTPMDVWVLRETCLGREYERFGIDLCDGWTYLDIGAAFGDFAIWVAHRFPASLVYACEPFPGSFDLLRQNLELNGISNVRPFPYALGGHTGPMTLYRSAAEPVEYSTTRQGEATRTEALQVQGFSLDDLFRELSLEQCDFVKMDCEGAEYEILFGAGEDTLDRLRHLCLEYHEGVTPYSHLDLVRFLTVRGFRVQVRPNRAWRGLGLLSATHARFAGTTDSDLTRT